VDRKLRPAAARASLGAWCLHTSDKFCSCLGPVLFPMDEQRLARGVACEHAAQLWEHSFEVHACVAQVVDAPEVLTIIESMPELSQFLNSLYQCQYHDFFKVCCASSWFLRRCANTCCLPLRAVH